MIPDTFIQELLSRVDIVDVVGRYVQLRKGGANLLGLCPFHNEKSPSFTVSPTKQFYHCFGCGAHGSAITFLMEHTGSSFPEAVRNLASTAGMSVPEEPRSPRQQAADRERKAEVSRQTEIMEVAQRHYTQSLKASPAAIQYLKGRGLDGKIAAHFGLGWAGGDRQGLAAVFKHYTDPGLVENGLVIESEDGRRYDRFRERVMFPIRNARGQLIGFGGRIIGKGEPKYLNSPETPLFTKGRELYGMWEGRHAIRQEGVVIVVEGYMDVVSLAQQGIGNAVATLGTATTPDHVQKLLRASDRIVFSFDGDKAGRKAAWRALQACLPWLRDDAEIRFLFLPEEHDPDSYVRALGAEAFRACLKEAQTLSRFLLQELAARYELGEAEGRARCLHDAKPLLQAMPQGGLRLQIERELARSLQLTPEEMAGLIQADTQGASEAEQDAGHSLVQGYSEHYDPAPDDSMPHMPSYPQGGQSYGQGYGQGGQSNGGRWRAGQGGGDRRFQGQGRDGGGKWRRGDNGRGGPPAFTGTRRPVSPLAVRLLHLLVVHPALVDDMGEQQLEVLDRGPHLGLVHDLIVLAQSSGARHLGALLEAADPESELAGALSALRGEMLEQEALPDPQAEWDDALQQIELASITQEMGTLVAGGLPDERAKSRYQQLSARLATIKRGQRLDLK